MRRGALLLLLCLTCADVLTFTQQPDAPAPGPRARFLDMFARGYFPGRTGQLMIVPREGDIITRDDPSVRYMHGSPWAYDVTIPLFFVGPGVKRGTYATAASHQDVAVTLAAALGISMPPTATGQVLPVLTPGGPRPRAIMLLVLDAMRLDYFDRYAAEIPTLTRLRKESAWLTGARVNYLPTNTGVGHTTIATGADPRVHGITGNNLFDRVKRTRRESYDRWDPGDLMALTLTDVWQLENSGRPVIIAVGPSVQASTALAGHGACQLNGAPVLLAGYEEKSGTWATNPRCYAPIAALREMNAATLWPADGLWMGHKIDRTTEVKRSGLFPRFEADAAIRLIEASTLGQDEITDIISINYKAGDWVAHKHGPDSPELRATLGEMDRHLERMLAALEARVGKAYLLAVTGDHGMPGEPAGAGRRHFAASIVEQLHARFDPQQKALITYFESENAQIFVDVDRLAVLQLTLRDLASFLESQPFIFAAFTEDEVRRTAHAQARQRR